MAFDYSPREHLRLGLIAGHREQYDKSVEFRAWVDTMVQILDSMTDRMARACTFIDMEDGVNQYLTMREPPPKLLIQTSRPVAELIEESIYGSKTDAKDG